MNANELWTTYSVRKSREESWREESFVHKCPKKHGEGVSGVGGGEGGSSRGD
jgi:hypothetical protein